MQLYIIAGPNGAGKTTLAKEFLPNFVDCPEFINADLIAGVISRFLRVVCSVSSRKGSRHYETKEAETQTPANRPKGPEGT